MIGLLLAMYPAQWRRRYGEEFRAVLESRPLGPFDVADVLLGALDARSRVLRLAGMPENHGGHHTMLRIGGVGAIVGGAFWVVGFIVSSQNSEGDASGWLALMAAGTVALLLAVVGLSAFQAHRNPRLAWAAFLIPAAGLLITFAGLIGSFVGPSDSPIIAGWSWWSIWVVGLVGTVVGSVLFAVATVQAAVLSRRGGVALAASSVLFLLIAMLGWGAPTMEPLAQLLFGGSVVAFGGSWAWLGLSALRRGPIRAVAPA